MIPANIRAELIAYKHWVNWKREPSERGRKKIAQGISLDGPGDWTKKPYIPDGFPVSSTNPGTWSDFEVCLKAYQGGDEFDGISFVLSKDEVHGDPFFGVDLDHCRDADDSMQPWVHEVIERFNSYTEVSPSGDGIRIFGKGLLPGKGRRNGEKEVYDHGRYVIVTGHALRTFLNPDQYVNAKTCWMHF